MKKYYKWCEEACWLYLNRFADMEDFTRWWLRDPDILEDSSTSWLLFKNHHFLSSTICWHSEGCGFYSRAVLIITIIMYQVNLYFPLDLASGRLNHSFMFMWCYLYFHYQATFGFLDEILLYCCFDRLAGLGPSSWKEILSDQFKFLNSWNCLCPFSGFSNLFDNLQLVFWSGFQIIKYWK